MYEISFLAGLIHAALVVSHERTAGYILEYTVLFDIIITSTTRAIVALINVLLLFQTGQCRTNLEMNFIICEILIELNSPQLIICDAFIHDA